MRYSIGALLLLASSSPALSQNHAEILASVPGVLVLPRAMSDDASVAVGYIYSNPPRPFRWTELDGLRYLPVVPNVTEARVTGLSADGRHATGRLRGPTTLAVRWTELESPVLLPGLGTPAYSTGDVISADGSTIAGTARLVSGETHAVRWLATGALEDLGSLGGDFANTFGISADGAAVVGSAPNAQGDWRGFHWTAATGMVDVGVQGQTVHCLDVSSDGSAVLGVAYLAGRDQLFLWTLAGGATTLHTAQNDITTLGVAKLSADGSAAIWYDYDESTNVAITHYWSAATGVVAPAGVELRFNDLSADGLTVTGSRVVDGDAEAFTWSASTGFSALSGQGNPSVSGLLISPDGSAVVGSSRNLELTRWRDSGEVGLPYCGPAIASSTGQPASLVAVGTNILGFGVLKLNGSALPTSAFGFLLASRAMGDVFPVSQSQGRLCLGGEIGRFVGPGQIVNAGLSGAFEFFVPTFAMPTPTGLVPGQPGDAWHFQAWFRDANPGTTSNFTNGVRVTLR